jgi:peptide/nickel transport system substrate-binding protein
MQIRKGAPVALWIMVFVLAGIIAACGRGEPQSVPAATPIGGPIAAAALAPPQLVNEVVFIEEPDFDKTIGMIEAGELHLYAYGTSDPSRERRIRNSPFITPEISYGSSVEFSFNPVGPTFPGTGQLNPFSVPAIREAMNWLIDRNHIVEEIYGGLAVPRYLPVNTTFPDYSRLADVARLLEIKYAHNPDRARLVITREMEALGATLENGRWHYQGERVRLIFIIRTEDERREAGDYLATLMEDLGFDVDRQYRSAAEASPIWIGGDPADGAWHLYTGGWIAIFINRDLAGNFNFYYTSRGRPEPLWQAYTPSPEFDEISEVLGRRDYATWEDRQRLMARALELALEDSARVWLVDTISIWPRHTDVNLAVDLAGGFSASELWPYTLGFVDPDSAQERVVFGTPSILTEPWNPVAGTNWVYDLMISRATKARATMPDPFTGLFWPQRVQRVEVNVEEGTPVTVTHDWVELNFVPANEVAADAWIDWDPTQERFITVGEQHPEGLTARTRTVVHYDDNLFSQRWHDGTPVTLGDMVVSFIMGLDQGKPESPIFDEAAVPSLETFQRHFRGIRILQEDPLVVEVYSDQIFPDAESIASSRSGYLFTSTPWHSLAIGMLAEQNRELAFSSSKADRLRVEWMSYIAGPSLAILDRFNNQAQEQAFIPYPATAGRYINAEEARERYRQQGQWRQERGHYWIGQGPFYLHSVHPVEKTVVIRRYDGFPDPPDKWLRFTDPRIAEVEVSGPTRVTLGETAQFQVEVSYRGEPYPVDDVEFVRFLLLDARGDLVSVGDAQAVQDGRWQVPLTPQQTADLAMGSSQLEVVVVSRVVSIPTFDRFSFLTVRP